MDIDKSHTPEFRARRRWLRATLGASGAAAVRLGTRWLPGMAVLSALPALAGGRPRGDYGNLLILVELKGGNDGLNTLVPFADPEYATLRPRLAQRRESLIHLSPREGFHGSLVALEPLWRAGELAVIRGVGYPEPNLSHFRSIEIWDTASPSAQYWPQGWLARAFAARGAPAHYAADGVVVGAGDAGPMAGVAEGSRTRIVTMTNTEQFMRQARAVSPAEAMGGRRSRALEHILKVESDIAQAARTLGGGNMVGGETSGGGMPPGPDGAFGNAVRTALRVLGGRAPVAALRLSLGGFDTHQNQAATHANLLRQLGDGLAALRTGLKAQGRWESALILTYAEFGRRPQENGSVGTDHGTANVHFALGGRVKGGLLGESPRLDRLQDGNLAHTVDFRSLYGSVLQHWWGLDAEALLGGRFPSLDLVRI